MYLPRLPAAGYAKHCMPGKRAPHSAHAPGSDCATGFETALHLAAKRLIEACGVLAFPELIASIAIVDDTGHVHKPEKQLVQAAAVRCRMSCSSRPLAKSGPMFALTPRA